MAQCLLVARLVLEDALVVEHAAAGRWRKRRLWFGIKSGREKAAEAAQEQRHAKGEEQGCMAGKNAEDDDMEKGVPDEAPFEARIEMGAPDQARRRK
jgi:hypothetical protein